MQRRNQLFLCLILKNYELEKQLISGKVFENQNSFTCTVWCNRRIFIRRWFLFLFQGFYPLSKWKVLIKRFLRNGRFGFVFTIGITTLSRTCLLWKTFDEAKQRETMLYYSRCSRILHPSMYRQIVLSFTRTFPDKAKARYCRAYNFYIFGRCGPLWSFLFVKV